MPNLHKQKIKFQRIGQKRIFGIGTKSEIESSLHRVLGKKPSPKALDLATRIFAVLNGHGTDYDILNFRGLVLQFQKETGIRINELFIFLRKSKPPLNRKNAIQVAKLDRNALQYAEFLIWLERLVNTIDITPDGKIIKKPANINTKNRDLLQRYINMKKKEETKAKTFISQHIIPEKKQ